MTLEQELYEVFCRNFDSHSQHLLKAAGGTVSQIITYAMFYEAMTSRYTLSILHEWDGVETAAQLVEIAKTYPAIVRLTCPIPWVREV